MKIIDKSEVTFSPTSIIDRHGKVFFHDGKVYRAIYSKEYAKLYTEILLSDWINEAFDSGLVKTSISEAISLNDAFVTLEHEVIPFETHPAEFTSSMHWLAAKAIITVNRRLLKHGLILKDAHPWNIMFKKGIATVVDFGSITQSENYSHEWFEEFKKYFCVPIWIASSRWNEYACEYRKQHHSGFGIKLFENKYLDRFLFNQLNNFNQPRLKLTDLLTSLDCWLDNHKPASSKKESWADYRQCGETIDHLQPENPKHKFVYEILRKEKPAKVLDIAANKGYYSEMSARLGAAVLACDYEEYCVDQCQVLAQEKKLEVTPALVNFSWPTPNFGLALTGRSAFERFYSDIVLALGLMHHICIIQRIPVEIFCEICMQYAKRGVVLEFVDPSDSHVANWQKPVPEHYSIDDLVRFFGRKFPHVTKGSPITTGGLCRSMIFFSN